MKHELEDAEDGIYWEVPEDQRKCPGSDISGPFCRCTDESGLPVYHKGPRPNYIKMPYRQE